MASTPSDLATFGARVRDTFAAPGRMARQIRAGTPWMDVLLLSTVVAIIAVATVPDEVFIDQMRDAVTRRGRPVEITSPADEVARWGRYIAMLATLGTHPLVVVTLAGLMTLIFSLLVGGSGSFRDFLSLTSHASLVPAAGSLLAIVIRIGAGGEARGWAGAFLEPSDAPNAFVAALLSLDPFVIWMLVILGIGVHVFDPRRSAVIASLLLVGVYLLMLLATAALLFPEA